MSKTKPTVAFAATPIIWIQIRGERDEKDPRRLRADDGLVARFLAWVSSERMFSTLGGTSSPGYYSGGWAPDDAERVVEWLRKEGAKQE